MVRLSIRMAMARRAAFRKRDHRMNRPGLFRAVGIGGDDLEVEAPRVVCKGEYQLADTIVLLAKRYGVPVVERPELAEALSEVPLDEEIPAHLFELAASLLVELRIIGSTRTD